VSGDWSCTAYGPEAAEVGAICFVAQPGTRKCADQDECREVMTGERQRVFRAISEKAAAGDPVMAYLAEEFASPDQILGGDDSGDQ
jgi:hypothetical protein